MDGSKVCTKCQLELPVADFGKDNRHPERLRSRCKKCDVIASQKSFEKVREVNIANMERFNTVAWLRTEKICCKCKQMKRHYDFSIDIKTIDGCRDRCKECSRNRAKCAPNPWTALRRLAKYRGKSLSLSEQEYRDIVACNSCLYCGGPLPKSGCGLDRIDNSRGYEPGNVVPCCGRCNRIRSDNLTYEEMLRLAPLLRQIFADRKENAA